MKLDNKVYLEVAEFDLKLTESEITYYKRYAMENIEKDEDSLISWAINDILRKCTNLLEGKTESDKRG